MKISLCLGICLLTIQAIAGGIRGAYERLYVWYAYQAEIEYAREKHKTFDIKNLRICPRQEGTGPDKTLTFGEFLELSNRQGDTKGPIPKITPDSSLEITVDRILNLQGRYKMRARWLTPNNIISSAKNSYLNMLKDVAKVLSKCKKELGDRSSIASATTSLDLVSSWRKADYDSHRLPALRQSPDFDKIDWKTWELEPPRNHKDLWNKHIDWESTINSNHNKGYANIENIDTHVFNWEENTFFKSPEGADAKTHRSAMLNAQDVMNVFKSGKGCGKRKKIMTPRHVDAGILE